eukprot:CAMPEP_0177776576 /NCGR_PEP_ID=MMETSP0491_2-20121128/14790_1 /TAXON_ID=63592 /ORGANISM="Tetraselmis chuii, Strain PLY429" /LENGTH=84 /DNA_ID=CAMNT_0019295383 /DNA_START=224 /DNA_END=475 /DNA_ORIENTATION=+
MSSNGRRVPRNPAPRGPGSYGIPGGGVPGGREAWLLQLQDSYETKAVEATMMSGDDAAKEAAKRATCVLNHKMTRYEKMHPDKV